MVNNVAQKIEEIENKYPVETIKYKDIPIWPFIRFNLFSIWFDKINNSEIPCIISNTKKTNNKFKSLFYLIKFFCKSYKPYLIKKNSNLLFVNECSLRIIDNKNNDQICAGLFEIYNKIIPIVPNDEPDSKYPYKKYISNKFLNYYSRFFRITFDYKYLYNYNILESIKEDLNIDYDFVKFTISTLRLIKLYEVWFSKIQPQKIFVNCYYASDRLPAIYVAKRRGIPVIEFQHGMIGKNHIAYNTYKKIEPNPYPDKFLMFGQKYLKQVSDNIYKAEQLLINGHYYIDYIRKNITFNRTEFKEKYGVLTKKTITVASMTTVDKQLFDYFVNFAKVNHDYFILFIPREKKEYHNINNLENFAVEWDLDVYKCMQNSDLTVTVYSTCCFESLALGVPCLLLNINNLVHVFLDEYLDINTTMEICNIGDDILSKINKLLKKDKISIINEGNQYYASDHMNLLKKNVLTI